MATTTVTQTTTKEDATKALLDRAAQAHTKPLWLQMARLNPPQPDPRCAPHAWRYADVRPSLLEASDLVPESQAERGDLFPESQAERRVLMLSNPSRDPPFTTDTLYAGLQLVKAGETARAHRHTAFAMRFIIEGEGGFTAVQGQRVAMRRGDVITTPRWNCMTTARRMAAGRWSGSTGSTFPCSSTSLSTLSGTLPRRGTLPRTPTRSRRRSCSPGPE